MKCAVIRICCDRQDGVEYFDSYDEAASWRAHYERSLAMETSHERVGILLRVDLVDSAPPHVGLEDHQLWVWLKDHWEVRGTGAML